MIHRGKSLLRKACPDRPPQKEASRSPLRKGRPDRTSEGGVPVAPPEGGVPIAPQKDVFRDRPRRRRRPDRASEGADSGSPLNVIASSHTHVKVRTGLVAKIFRKGLFAKKKTEASHLPESPSKRSTEFRGSLYIHFLQSPNDEYLSPNVSGATAETRKAYMQFLHRLVRVIDGLWLKRTTEIEAGEGDDKRLAPHKII